MAGRDIIMVRQKELKWLHVIHKVFEGALTQGQAAEILSLSERQVRRIVRRIRDEGDGGIQHQSRGRASNRRIPKKNRGQDYRTIPAEVQRIWANAYIGETL